MHVYRCSQSHPVLQLSPQTLQQLFIESPCCNLPMCFPPVLKVWVFILSHVAGYIRIKQYKLVSFFPTYWIKGAHSDAVLAGWDQSAVHHKEWMNLWMNECARCWLSILEKSGNKVAAAHEWLLSIYTKVMMCMHSAGTNNQWYASTRGTDLWRKARFIDQPASQPAKDWSSKWVSCMKKTRKETSKWMTSGWRNTKACLPVKISLQLPWVNLIILWLQWWHWQVVRLLHWLVDTWLTLAAECGIAIQRPIILLAAAKKQRTQFFVNH